MKKLLVTITILFFVLSSINAQNSERNNNPVPQMDSAVKIMAAELHKKLTEKRGQKIAIGQFVYRGSISPFGTYWVSQLTDELANIPNKTYTLISGGVAGADLTISGEIVDVANIIRVYTRLVRSEGRVIEAAFQSELERSQALNNMLVASSGASSSSVIVDEYEIDSMAYPVVYEIGVDGSAAVINRTIHSGDDEDFFLLLPDRDGRLVMETTGSFDTVMELYDEETMGKLAEDDDGGSGNNARIRYNARAGARYIAKVRGYSSAGNYGFRAYISVRTGGSSWESPVSYEIGNNENAPVARRTIEDDDADHILLIPGYNGRLIIETTGDMDTYMRLYDADSRQELASDDDSGSGYNAKITYNAQAGRRYMVMITDLNEDGGSYGFKAYLNAR